MTVAELLQHATEELDARGVPSPRVDAEYLAAKALGRTRSELYVGYDGVVGEPELAAFGRLLRRRARREPLAYILGEWGFRRLSLSVDPRVLIPRPETEVVVERCLALLADLREPEVLDVGTGSGAIALALADEHGGVRVTAVDSSRDALEVARANVARTGLGHRIRLLARDLTEGLGGSRFDLVVSNPPYVSPEEIDGLQPEVRDWEPRAALVGVGVAGAVARAAREALKHGGWLVLETGDGQARAVADELHRLGYAQLRVTRDLADRARVVEGRRPHAPSAGAATTIAS